MIKVSVIMPTYGRPDFLERAAKSVLSQTHKNIELVIINDNIPESTEDEDTKDVINKINDRRIKPLHTTGKTGGGAARNLGLKECTGDYIAFLDDDDIYLQGKIAHQLKYMEDNGLDVSFQDVKWCDESGKIVEYRKMDRVREFTYEGLMRAHIMYSIAPTSIYMVKRSALDETTVFGEVPRGQDFFFMVSLIQKHLKIGYMPGAYVVQYLHKGERISVGPEFVNKVTEEWKNKKALGEGILSKRDYRYMDFRLNCVCGFATLRGGDKKKAIPFFVKAFFYSPIDSFKEAYRYFKRKR